MATIMTKAQQLRKNTPEKKSSSFQSKKGLSSFGKSAKTVPKPINKSKAKQLYRYKAEDSKSQRKEFDVLSLKIIQPSVAVLSTVNKVDTPQKAVHLVSKSAQLKKEKSQNPKIMTISLYQLKCDWLFNTYPLCQICNKRKSAQAHHARYGYRGRDDRTILAVCEPCHTEIHHGKNGVSQSRDELELLGESTHIEWELLS